MNKYKSSSFKYSKLPTKQNRIVGAKYITTYGKVRIWDGKYLKCIHKNYPYRCKDCGGSSLCKHGKVTPRCKFCKNGITPNPNIQKWNELPILKKNRIEGQTYITTYDNIRVWDGKYLKCIHNKFPDVCIACKGVGTCKHRRVKYNCKECKGNGRCEHGNIRYGCKECKGKGICKHDMRKEYCKKCKGTQICLHGTTRNKCKKCATAKIITNIDV